MRRNILWFLLAFLGIGLFMSFQNCSSGFRAKMLAPVNAVQATTNNPPGGGSGVLDLAHWHGVNVDTDISDQDLDRIRRLGFNLIRLNMNKQPLMHKQAPYDFDEVAMARMKAIIDSCRLRGISVVMDPHTTPGTEKTTTTLNKDKLWREPFFQNLLIKLWDRLSSEYANEPTVIAYDLLNEPSTPEQAVGGPPILSWNDLAAKLVRHVRVNDPKKIIIVESSAVHIDGVQLDRIDSVPYLKIPKDDNLLLSVHMYAPHQFTNQGLRDFPTGIKYPGLIGGQPWDRSALREKLNTVKSFADQNHLGVFIGEFSVSRCSDPVSADQYLTDLLDIFSGNEWAWAYLSYSSKNVWWSLEEPVSEPCGMSDAGAPSREEILSKFLEKQ